MIKVENIDVYGFEVAIRGMRNPMNSWDKSDSEFIAWNNTDFEIGENDLKLMRNLCKAGPDHRKFLRMINVTMDITAPLYWWKEFDTYKVGTVTNSCSTMHKIHAKRFERDDFSIEYLENCDEQHWMVCMDNVISALNVAREKYLEAKENGADGFTLKRYWWQMIQLLPTSYNQRRTVMLNYETLLNMYRARKNHKLDEWRMLCSEIENLPLFMEITGNYESGFMVENG